VPQIVVILGGGALRVTHLADLASLVTSLTSRADDQLAIPARVLSSTQLALLAQRGEELTAEVGEKLYEIGDATYPFIALLEGEVVVLDGAGHEIARHVASGFLGEVNLLSGQAVFVTAVVTLFFFILPGPIVGGAEAAAAALFAR